VNPMSDKIGRFIPGMANVPIAQTDDGRRTRELLRTPGGLVTAKVQIGNVKVETEETKVLPENAQLPGLFPENPYADDSPSPASISPADSLSGKAHEPAPAPEPIAHHAEISQVSQEYRRWAEAFHNRPVDEVEVQKVKDLLAGKPLAEAQLSKMQPSFTQQDLDEASNKLGELGLITCANWEGKIFYRLPKHYSVEKCKEALPAIGKYAYLAKLLNDELKTENGEGLLKAVTGRIGQLSLTERISLTEGIW
jgi:hypothetical protein